MPKRILLLLLAFALPALAQTLPVRTARGVAALQKHYNQATGLYPDTGWWNSANAIQVLADYSVATHSKQFVPVFANTLTAAQKKFPGFLNEYYDDEGWWALAWIRVYDLTKDPQYLTMASSIFTDMTGAWDDTCHGGIWWSKQRKYKNAIANELFLTVAASLANRAADKASYSDWAQKEWAWFQQSGMINSLNLVNDGLTSDCQNNGHNTWSYNQGVLLGGLAELSKLQKSNAPLEPAQRIARSAMILLSDSEGILHDRCETRCNEDGTQFKGIFLRNVAAIPETPESRSFIATNANAVWTRARFPDDNFGQVWSGPAGYWDKPDGAKQSSALDALVAALRIAPKASK